MRVKDIKIVDYGAIENLKINFETLEDKPLISVIVGANGSGKTLLLTHIVDSLIEMKRKKYTDLQEVEANKYYKMGLKSYIRYGKLHSVVEINLVTESKVDIQYLDIMTRSTERFTEEYNGEFENLDFKNAKFIADGFYREIKSSGKELLNDSILLYFPVSRYSEPSWFNKENRRYRLTKDIQMVGKSYKNIIKENVLSEMEDWIINLILDKHVYEIKTIKQLVFNEDGQSFLIDSVQYLNGRNTKLIEMLNRLLTIIFSFKYPTIEYARIGVSTKKDRSISIYVKEKGREEFNVSPTFGHLSSGEAMLISLFGSLLKEYDDIAVGNFEDIKDVTGIVLIDEIDLNLHIQFAKEILPLLMKEFPKVQFIVTSHSPFFLLGMEEKCKDLYRLYSLPNGQEISIDDFQEVQLAYETFIENFSDYQNQLKETEMKLSSITKPLIITEGKTDWKHLKGALNRFKESGVFMDLELEFLDDPKISLSDSQLNSLLVELSKVPQSKKIIGIFDSDAKNGKDHAKLRYKDFGNNVYALSIPTPEHRKGRLSGISIEFLYKDEDLLKCDSNGRRIFLTSEFNKLGRLNKDNKIGLLNFKSAKEYLEKEYEKIIDCEVYDIEGNSLALSKNSFAEYILGNIEPFDKVDIEGFKAVFDLIKEIIGLSNQVEAGIT